MELKDLLAEHPPLFDYATREQPEPTGEGTPVAMTLAAIIQGPGRKRQMSRLVSLADPGEEVDEAGDFIAAEVVKDILARRELGIKRYGVPLRADNGRDALVDAYQEALDLLVYLTQVGIEFSGKYGSNKASHPPESHMASRMFHNAQDLTFDLRMALLVRDQRVLQAKLAEMPDDEGDGDGESAGEA